MESISEKVLYVFNPALSFVDISFIHMPYTAYTISINDLLQIIQKNQLCKLIFSFSMPLGF
jgi:hypothetical protein